MPNVRMFPSPLAQYQTLTVNGRTYTGTPGSVVDVVDFDAGPLEANGWARVAKVGPTSARPAATVGPETPTRGTTFFDTTVGDLIVYDGATWRSPVTGSAV